MKKKVVILSHFVNFPEESGFDRLFYIAEKLSCDYEVELITSNFSHSKKTHREKTIFESINRNFKVTLIYEPYYRKNISFKRFISHGIFAKNVKKYLVKNIENYDLIYVAIPSISVVNAVVDLNKKYNKPFVLDVQDLWPDAFKMFIKNNFIYNVLTMPLRKKVSRIYNSSNSIIAVSETYKNIIINEYNINKPILSVYIGSILIEPKRLNDDRLRLVYTGTISHSYDLRTVLEAFKILKIEGYNDITLNVIGDGNQFKMLKAIIEKEELDVNLLGYQKYDFVMKYLSEADIGLHSLIKESYGSITNKFSDYCCAGLAILNSCSINEVKETVVNEKIGMNYESYNPSELADKIKDYYYNRDLLKEHQNNSLKIANLKFHRENTYNKIFEEIGRILNENSQQTW